MIIANYLFYHRLWAFLLAVLAFPLFCQVKLCGPCASLRHRFYLTLVSNVCVSILVPGRQKTQRITGKALQISFHPD